MGVGTFPGMKASRRRTIRAPTNPLDKSTIVSIYPRRIDEVKPTIQPGRFIIEAGTLAIPALLVVGSSSWWKDTSEDEPLLEIPNYSIQVAESIVRDYCNGLIGCDMKDSMPGLFWVPGEFTVEAIRAKHSNLLERAARRQKTYYEAIVKLTDSLWARTNGNPLTVSDDARMAARELGISRDWMTNFQSNEQVRCIACGAFRNPNFPVCQTCKAVADPAKAQELGLVFAN